MIKPPESKTTKENFKIIFRWLAHSYDKETENSVFSIQRELDRYRDALRLILEELEYDITNGGVAVATARNALCYEGVTFRDALITKLAVELACQKKQ